jgi:uncharacterized membrane protein YccC
VLDRAIPALSEHYQSMQAHLERLALDLSEAVEGSAEKSWQAAQAALGQFSSLLANLCQASADQAQSLCQALDPEQKHLRTRSDDLLKQAKLHTELGTPAAGHLGIMVNIVHHLEDLLKQAKVLNAQGEP